MNTHEVFCGALNELDREGFGRGGPYMESSGLCVGQALARATGAAGETEEAVWIHAHAGGYADDDDRIPAVFAAAMDRLQAHVGTTFSVHGWNDDVCEGEAHARRVLTELIAATAPPPPAVCVEAPTTKLVVA